MARRAYRYRFYPTEQQEALLSRTFGCVRYVYNRALEERSRARAEGKRLGYRETSALLTAWKADPESRWLTEVSSVPLQQTLRHLQCAFVNHWQGRARHPRYKSKRRRWDSAEFTRSAFRWRDGELWLAKSDQPLDIAWSRSIPAGAEPSTVTVSRDPAGRWHVSMLVDDPTVVPLDPETSAVGLDLGVTTLMALSTGEKVANPRHERRDLDRLVRLRKALTRKVIGSHNRERARKRLARANARVVDRRRDFLHKLSTRLIRENQTVVVEDLQVQSMTASARGSRTRPGRNVRQKAGLNRSIRDAGWAELRYMLDYKAGWYGRRLVVVDRWFPSSKLCSNCGHSVADLPRGARSWTCVRCGSLHDRDVNAARNILAAGLAATACGDDVGPVRSDPSGRSSVNQESRSVTSGTPAC